MVLGVPMQGGYPIGSGAKEYRDRMIVKKANALAEKNAAKSGIPAILKPLPPNTLGKFPSEEALRAEIVRQNVFNVKRAETNRTFADTPDSIPK